MALLVRAEDLQDVLGSKEIVEAVEEGCRRCAKGKAYNHPR